MTTPETVNHLNEALAEKHLALWTERDRTKRQEMINEVYAGEVKLTSPSDVITGAAAVNDYIAQQQASYPGYRFKATRHAAAHHDAVMITWECGPESAPGAVSGVDVLQISDEKIQSITIFIDD